MSDDSQKTSTVEPSGSRPASKIFAGPRRILKIALYTFVVVLVLVILKYAHC
jgi:hypothetical protein